MSGLPEGPLPLMRSILVHEDRFTITRSPSLDRTDAAKCRPSLKLGCQFCRDLTAQSLRRRPSLSGSGHRVQSRSCMDATPRSSMQIPDAITVAETLNAGWMSQSGFEVAVSEASPRGPEGIYQFHPRWLEVGDVSRDHDGTSHEGCGCDLNVGAIVSQFR